MEEVAEANARRDYALADLTMSPPERLIYWWNCDKARGATDAELRALETRCNVRLPDGFRAYLEATMPDGNEWDGEGTRWWPLADIKTVWDECGDWDTRSALDSKKLLVFADVLIWCYAWAIDCSEMENRGKIALITGHDHYVADSFEEFLDRYLRDEHSIHR